MCVHVCMCMHACAHASLQVHASTHTHSIHMHMMRVSLLLLRTRTCPLNMPIWRISHTHPRTLICTHTSTRMHTCSANLEEGRQRVGGLGGRAAMGNEVFDLGASGLEVGV